MTITECPCCGEWVDADDTCGKCGRCGNCCDCWADCGCGEVDEFDAPGLRLLERLARLSRGLVTWR